MLNIFLRSKLTAIVVLLILVALSVQGNTTENINAKPRVLVLTDIEADPDDSQSLVRMLLYVNQIDLEGVVAATSIHQKTRVAPEAIHQIINAYDKVHANLRQHEKGYPKAKSLRALVKTGLPVYGMQGVGKGKDSDGSEWIISVLEEDDDRPLWISVWGGPNTLAQALYKLKKTKSEIELNRLIAKLRVYTISDQDDSAAWIRKNFPSLFYIVSPGGYDASTWKGISFVVDGVDNTSISNEWLSENIQQGHGPLGVQYLGVAYGMEGDTPAWLNLIDNGLSNPELPNWGGWGGRYELYVPQLEDTQPQGFTGGVPVEQETRPIWTNAIDHYTPPKTLTHGRAQKLGDKTYTGFKTTLWRWRNDFQNDFAARMDWTVKTYEEANHAPVAVLKHPERITVKSKASFHLDARGSYDPDDDSLSYYWFNYPEAGSLEDEIIKVSGAENMPRVKVIAPKVSEEQELHFILQLRDRGEPKLTRYKRVIVTVEP